MTADIPQLLVLAGSDRARKQERVRAVAERFHVDPLDWHTLEAAACAAGPLNALIRERPMAGPRKLIVIDDADRLDRACAAMLEVLRETWPETASVILLVEASPERQHPLAALLKGRAVEWYRAAPQAAASRGGFALLNAVAKRDPAAALQELDAQLLEGKDGLELLGSLVWQLQRWLTVARWRQTGVSAEAIAEAMQLEVWQVDRILGELRGRTLGELRDCLERCWELDVAAKRGRTPSLRTALEQLVLRVCLPAQAVTPGRTAPSPRAVS